MCFSYPSLSLRMKDIITVGIKAIPTATIKLKSKALPCFERSLKTANGGNGELTQVKFKFGLPVAVLSTDSYMN